MGPAFSLLGPLEVRSAVGALVHLGGLKQRGLLAVLLLHRGVPVPVDRLVLALWGDTASDGAATTLRSHVGRVRRLLEEAGTSARLESRSGGYVLDVEPAEVDVDCFEALLADGRGAAAAGRLVEADELLDAALSLWRGEVLTDLDGADFTIAPAADLAEKRLGAEEARIDVQLALGRHLDVVPDLQALVERHPYRERFAAQLMRALYRSGRQADALAVASTTRARLADELGIDPGAELQELETAVLRQSPDLDLVELPTLAPSETARVEPDAVPLLERDTERAVLVAAVAAASAGEGRCVAVAADAGGGKTSLVRAACADGPPVRVLRGSCDPLSTPRPYGPLRDIARRASITAWDSGTEMVLADICDEVVAALAAEPTVLVVEDLHWVDAATVEVLRFLARRSATLQLSLLLTYRDNEISPQHPARPLLGDLARLDNATSVHLDALSIHGVAALLGEGSTLEAERVHALTGGNPFFVVEVCSDPDRPLPASVRDALLDRTAGLPAEDLHVLQLAALCPDRLDPTLMRVLNVGLPTLDRLESTGLLDRDGSGLGFRHELARQAIVDTIPSGGAPELHTLLLNALEQGGHREPAVLTHHAVAALDADRAFRYAVAAAEHAALSGAHGDAAAFYEVALRHQHDPVPGDRAELLLKLSFEQYLISRLEEAIGNVESSFALWQQAGDGAGLATAYDRYSVFAYYAADRQQAESYAERAAVVAKDAGLPVPHGAARATRGFLGFLRGDLDLARSCALEATRAAESDDVGLLSLRARVITTLADMAADDNGVRPDLLRLIGEARSDGWDELASTGFSQLASLDVEHGRLADAVQVLDESIPFTERRELPICRHWQTAVRARVHLGHGDWDLALVDANHVIESDGMLVARLWPFLIDALVPVRRGQDVDPSLSLDRAWQLAVAIDEPMRRLSVLAVLAEVMWTRRITDPRVVEHAAADLARLAAAPGAHWAAGELAVWLRRLDLLPSAPDGLAEPYTAALAGRHREAADWWRQRDQDFAGALCLLDSEDSIDRQDALDTLARLEALGTLARVSDRSSAAVT